MIRRLLAATGVATTLLGATFVASPTAGAAPGDPTQVALLVQYPDSSTRTFCVGYRSGMTGADVLAVAGPSYGTGPYAGFVLQIGGQGNTRTKPPSDNTYWAYWRGTSAGSYTYSGTGVSSSQPAAGSVEAWVWYENGAVSFPHRSYASLCPGGVATTPAPASPAPTVSRVAAPTGSGGGPGTTASTAAPAPGSTGSSTTSAASVPVTPGSSTAAPAAAGAAPSSGGTGAGVPTGSTTSVAVDNAAVTTDDGGLGAGATVGLLVAAVAVVAFGVLTVVARRRRTDQD